MFPAFCLIASLSFFGDISSADTSPSSSCFSVSIEFDFVCGVLREGGKWNGWLDVDRRHIHIRDRTVILTLSMRLVSLASFKLVIRGDKVAIIFIKALGMYPE